MVACCVISIFLPKGNYTVSYVYAIVYNFLLFILDLNNPWNFETVCFLILCFFCDFCIGLYNLTSISLLFSPTIVLIRGLNNLHLRLYSSYHSNLLSSLYVFKRQTYRDLIVKKIIDNITYEYCYSRVCLKECEKAL